MSPELEVLIEHLRWMTEVGDHPRITVQVEGSVGGKGVLVIEPKVLTELLGSLPIPCK